MKKSIIIGILIFVFIIFLLYFFISDSRKLTLPEKYLKDGITFIEKVIDTPIKFVDEFIEDQKNKKDILKKYNKLKQKVEQYKLTEEKYKETNKELNEIKQNINITSSLINYDVVHAYTIKRDIGYWYKTITIDKGENDNIDIGDAVINSKGLIGTIIKTTKTTSTVKLLTGIDLNTRISVKIQIDDIYLYGLLSNYENGKFIIEGISDNREILEGSIVTTTGIDNSFPAGITVGEVSKTTSDNFDLTRTVYMRSSVDFDDISYVMILKRVES